MPKRTPAEERQMACWSTMYTVRRRGRATVRDVMREQGLAEFSARRALEELRRAGKLKKQGREYLPVGR